jgi:D-alanyl-D-alanine carboxypeptidase
MPIFLFILFNLFSFLSISSANLNKEIGNFLDLKPEITATSALVVDLETERVLFQKNPEKVLPIASLTKLITSLVLIDLNIPFEKELKYSIKDTIKYSKGETPPAQIYFRNNERIKIKDLLAASLIVSANNTIKTLLREIKIDFVKRMNQKAKELEMNNSFFVEPTGLDPKNVSTANDLVKLIKAINKEEKIRKLLESSSISFFTNLNGKKKFYLLKNKNKILNDFNILIGKTGYTEEAGYCFAGIVEYNKRKFIVILLGSKNKNTRNEEIKSLVFWAHNYDELF